MSTDRVHGISSGQSVEVSFKTIPDRGFDGETHDGFSVFVLDAFGIELKLGFSSFDSSQPFRHTPRYWS